MQIRGKSKVLTFATGGDAMAVAAAAVTEIVVPDRITRVPQAPAGLLGLMNFRGKILPVVTLSPGAAPASSAAPTARVVVMEDDTASVGVWVDQVHGLQDSFEGRHIDLAQLSATQVLVPRQQSPARADAPAVRSKISVEAVNRTSAYLCFTLAGQCYALPMNDIVEVMQVPPSVTALPRTDPAMMGVVDVRGTLVPLVSLRALLGRPLDDSNCKEARVILLRIGGRAVGLVADAIKAICHLSDSQRGRVPRLLHRGSAEAQVQEICRYDGGLVSILAVDKLFDEKTSALVLAQASEGGEMKNPAGKETEEQFVIFQLGDECYGLPILSVDEIVRRPGTLTRVPRSPAFVEGVMNLRGKMIPVIDQRRRFGVASSPDQAFIPKVVVVTVNGLQTGLVVDRVSEILTLMADEYTSAPQFGQDGTAVFNRVAMIERGGRMILLVDPQALLDRAEREAVSALKSEAEEASLS